MDSPRPIPKSIFLILLALFVVCPLLFFTDLTRNPYYTQIMLLNVLVPLAWLIWLVQAWRKREGVWVTSALDLPLLLLIAVSALSWASSFWQHRAFMKPIYSEGSKAMIFLLVNTYLVYAMAIRSQDRTLFRTLLWITYAVSVVASVYGICQYFGMELIWPHNLNPYGNRPVSTFGNPNFMSTYLVAVLPVMVADYLFGATGAPRTWLWLAILCTFGALLATLTRSSWFGLAAALIVLAIGVRSIPAVWPRIRRAAIILGLGMAVLTVAWPRGGPGVRSTYRAAVLERLGEVKSVAKGGYASASQRFLIWSCAASMTSDHPWLGKGWGCFELFYPYYQGAQLLKPEFRGLRTHANNAHNEVLEYLSQIGFVGFGILLFLWVVFFRTGASIASRQTEPWRIVVWAMMGGVAGVLVDNLLNVSVHFCMPAFIFWWWIGSVMVLEPAALRVHTISLQAAWRRAGVAVAGIGLACLIVRSVFLWLGEINFFEGFKRSKAGQDLPEAIRYLEKAYDYHHLEVNNNYELANVYARSGRKDKALMMYERAIDANPGYDEIFFNKATTESQLGHYDDAMQDYRKCLAMNPLSHDAYNALVGLYMRDLAKHAGAAEALYRQAVEFFPNDKDIWNNYGYLETKLEHWEEAYAAYRRAVEIDPDFELGRQNLRAVIVKVPQHRNDPLLTLESRYQEIDRLLDQKRVDPALAIGRQLAEQFPRSFRAHFYLGNIYFAMNQPEQALAEFEKVVQLQPNALGGWQNLSIAADRLNKHEVARAAAQRLLQLDPENAFAKGRVNTQ